MVIILRNLQKKIQLNLHKIKTIARIILKHEKVDQSDLSIVFVTSQKIRALNHKYLSRNRSTDVLAFDTSDEVCTRSKAKVKSLSGDIIISTDAVTQNSKRFKTTISHELVLYIVHGILHLLGYDDHAKRDIAKMRAREEALMEYLGKKIKNVIE